jgi:hypothetical protein
MTYLSPAPDDSLAPCQADTSEATAIDADTLGASLKSSDPAEVRRAEQLLLQLGPDAVELLGPLLRHREAGVRKAAVEWLGRIGDARAIEPLRRALEQVEGRSERHRRRGVAYLIIAPMVAQLVARVLWQHFSAFPATTAPLEMFSSAIVQTFGMAGAVLWLTRVCHRSAAPLIEALGSVAARNTALEFAGLTAELSAIAGNRLLQPRETREAARGAAAAIGSAVGAREGLPVPAHPPMADATSLPLPASAAGRSVESRADRPDPTPDGSDGVMVH